MYRVNREIDRFWQLSFLVFPALAAIAAHVWALHAGIGRMDRFFLIALAIYLTLALVLGFAYRSAICRLSRTVNAYRRGPARNEFDALGLAAVRSGAVALAKRDRQTLVALLRGLDNRWHDVVEAAHLAEPQSPVEPHPWQAPVVVWRGISRQIWSTVLGMHWVNVPNDTAVELPDLAGVPHHRIDEYSALFADYRAIRHQIVGRIAFADNPPAEHVEPMIDFWRRYRSKYS